MRWRGLGGFMSNSSASGSGLGSFGDGGGSLYMLRLDLDPLTVVADCVIILPFSFMIPPT
jgi:hypothetical protein